MAHLGKIPRIDNIDHTIKPPSIGDIVGINVPHCDEQELAKIIDIANTRTDNYSVMLLYSGTALNITLSQMVKPKRDVINKRLRKDILNHRIGDTVEFSGGYIYLGGDDIIIHKDLANKSKII